MNAQVVGGELTTQEPAKDAKFLARSPLRVSWEAPVICYDELAPMLLLTLASVTSQMWRSGALQEISLDASILTPRSDPSQQRSYLGGVNFCWKRQEDTDPMLWLPAVMKRSESFVLKMMGLPSGTVASLSATLYLDLRSFQSSIPPT